MSNSMLPCVQNNSAIKSTSILLQMFSSSLSISASLSSKFFANEYSTSCRKQIFEKTGADCKFVVLIIVCFDVSSYILAKGE